MKLFEFFDRLDEGRKEQFMAMLPKPFQEIKSSTGQIWKDRWAEEVNWALTTLKKQDRIVWYLRFAKANFLSYIVNFMKQDANSDLYKLAEKELKNFEKTFSEPTIDLQIKRLNLTTLKSQLGHYLSLNIENINKIVWDKQDPNELADQMAEIEKEWKDKQKSTIEHGDIALNDTTVIVKFQNGWQWINLNRSSCDIEGKAMGHCGNAASYNEHDTILSLREPVKGGWTPHLTFILDTSTGMLGEMKGRANNKPAEKYYPYIVALLKLSIIKGIMGGGYAPERNFSFNDLSPQQQDELIKLKPRLASFTYRYNHFGITDDLMTDLDKKLEQYRFNFTPEFNKSLGGESGAIVIGIESPEFFAARDKSFNYYSKIIENGYIDDIHIDETEILYFIESLPDSVYEKIKFYVKEKHPEIGIDLDDRKELYEFLKEKDHSAWGESLYSDFRKSLDQGYQSGTMEEIYKTLKEFMNEPLNYNQINYPESGGVGTNIEGVDKDITGWRTIFWMLPEIVFKWADNDTFSEITDLYELYAEYLDEFDHRVPQNGFWEYDKKSALEYFLDEHPEFSAEKKK